MPWGHTADRPATETGGDAFESSLRKIMLSAALGRLVNKAPAKRARMSEPAEAPETCTEAAADVVANSDKAVPDDLAVGQRVEVKWQLEGDDGAEAVWWGAELLARREDVPTESGAAQGGSLPSCGSPANSPATWTLRYDARDGFQREDRDAVLLTKHVLAHGDMDEQLAWRMEGETYEADSEDDDSDADQDEDAENMQRSYPVTAISKAIEAQMGCSVESAALQKLQASLPIEQQQTLAAGFNDFITSITSKLRRAADEKRDNAEGAPVIEADDVKAALAAWRSERGEAA